MLLEISDYFQYMCCIDTKLFDITQHLHKSHKFENYMYSI